MIAHGCMLYFHNRDDYLGDKTKNFQIIQPMFLQFSCTESCLANLFYSMDLLQIIQPVAVVSCRIVACIVKFYSVDLWPK